MPGALTAPLSATPVFGYVAVFFSLLYKLPQIYKIFVTRDVKAISLMSQVLQVGLSPGQALANDAPDDALQETPSHGPCLPDPALAPPPPVSLRRLPLAPLIPHTLHSVVTCPRLSRPCPTHFTSFTVLSFRTTR